VDRVEGGIANIRQRAARNNLSVSWYRAASSFMRPATESSAPVNEVLKQISWHGVHSVFEQTEY